MPNNYSQQFFSSVSEDSKKIIKIQRFLRKKWSDSNHFVEVDEKLVKRWKTDHPATYEYINYESIKKNPNNKLYFSFNSKKTAELTALVNGDDFSTNPSLVEILDNEHVSLYAFRAFHYEEISELQRSTINDIHNAYKEFRKVNVKTYPIFDKNENLTEEAKEYLAHFFAGKLIETDIDKMRQLLKELPPSEKCFTVIDITDYLKSKPKRGGNALFYLPTKSMFDSLNRNATKVSTYIKKNGRKLDVMIHNGAFDKFIRHFCNPNFSFYSKLGLFTEDDIASYQSQHQLRLAEEKIFGIEDHLRNAHGFDVTLRESRKHDVEFHTPLVACFPDKELAFLLNTLRPLVILGEELFPGHKNKFSHLKSILGDLEIYYYFREKFNAEKKINIEQLINELLSTVLNVVVDPQVRIIVTVLMAIDINVHPTSWAIINSNLFRSFEVSNFPLLCQIAQESVKNSSNVDTSENFLKLFTEILVKYMVSRYGDTRNYFPILEQLPESVLPIKKDLVAMLEKTNAILGNLLKGADEKKKAQQELEKYVFDIFSNSDAQPICPVPCIII